MAFWNKKRSNDKELQNSLPKNNGDEFSYKFMCKVYANSEDKAEEFVSYSFCELLKVIKVSSVISSLDEDSDSETPIYKVGGYVTFDGLKSRDEVIDYLVYNLAEGMDMTHLDGEINSHKNFEDNINNHFSNNEDSETSISITSLDDHTTALTLDAGLQYYFYPKVGDVITLNYSEDLINDFLKWGEFDLSMGKLLNKNGTLDCLANLPQGIGEEGLDPNASSQFLCSSLVQRRINEGINNIETTVVEIDNEDTWIVELENGDIVTLCDDRSGHIVTFSPEHIDPTAKSIKDSYWRLPLEHYDGLEFFDPEDNPIIRIISSPK